MFLYVPVADFGPSTRDGLNPAPSTTSTAYYQTLVGLINSITPPSSTAMASTDTRTSPYLQQTAKHLASRDPKSWTYPLWAYVVGCIGVACICLFNGYVSALVEKRDVRKRTEKDLEAGILPQVPSDGTFPDYMAKGPDMRKLRPILRL